MEVDKDEWKAIHRALSEWEHAGQLTPQQAETLKQTVVQKRSEQQVAQYFFFIALFCTLMAFGALFLNEKLLERMKVYFSLNDLIITLITAILSVAWFWYIGRKRGRTTGTAYEIYMVLGGLSVLTSLLYCCKQFHLDGTYTAFLSMSLVTFLILGITLRSKALWIGAILTALAWFGAVSIWLSSNNLFLGMNYAVRYTLFGLLVLGIAYMQRRVQAISFGQQITYTAGMLIFFTALWMVSIFGNYNTMVGWQQVRQVHVLAYSIVFSIATALSFYLGVRYKDDLARDLGVLFLLLNLYTRYFEYFWDSMNKGIFFLILAITFGLLGRWLDKKRKVEVKS